MAYEVDWKQVSTVGLEASPFAEALAGVRANEARYFANKYGIAFVTEPASARLDVVDSVARILAAERQIAFAATPLEVAEVPVPGIWWTYVFYDSGLSVNVLYTLDGGEGPPKRAVGFKLCEGMDVPTELVDRFKFARQRSTLAGEIRGTFFVVKGTYP